MATTPSTPGSPAPSPGNGTQPPGKPRATIILKNPNAKPGSPATSAQSAQSTQAAQSGGPISGHSITPAGNSQRLAPPRPSMSAPNPSARRPAVKVQTDREALGLSAARPSEMVEGLDEVVKRAEALSAREDAKRRSGGKLSANVALHVDDTGQKWALWVKLGIAATVLLVCAAGAYMLYKANHVPQNPRIQLAATKASLSDLEISAKKMDRFEASENLTVQTAKERLRKSLETQLDGIKKAIQKDRESGRNPDKGLTSKRNELENLLQFKDGWGNPFDFSVAGDELLISSPSKAEGVPEPLKIRIRGSDEPAKPDLSVKEKGAK